MSVPEDGPREVTPTELGEELGITQQAVGSRLRNGSKYVIRSTLSSFTVRP